MRAHVILGLVLFTTAAFLSDGAIIVDRIAVIIGDHVVLTSDIDRDIRLTAFLNRQELEISAQAKRKSAERLIDQDLIRREIGTGSYNRPPNAAGEALLSELIRDRFGGSQTDFQKALARYGVSSEQLQSDLLWQFTVVRFINERFGAGVLLSEDDVKRYYQQHQVELKNQNPGASQTVLESKSREYLQSQQADKSFTEWLDQMRNGTRIEYKQGAST